MIYCRFAFALTLAALCGPALGADLLNIFRDARLSDPVYQSARAQHEANLEKVPQARAGYLPIITGTASRIRNDLDREIASDVSFNTTTYTVTLSQPIVRVQNWIAITQAQQLVLQSEATLANAHQDLVLRVAQAYFDVLLAQDNVALSEAQKSAISEQLAQAKRNFEVGTATIVDTHDAQARYDQSVAKEISDKNDLEVKRRALLQLLGKLPDALTPLKEPLRLAEPQPRNIEDWVNSAHDASFTVAVARAGYEIARQEVDRQVAGHYPTLDLSGSFGRSTNPLLNTPGLTGPNVLQGQLGVILSVPIYAGGFTQSRVREALALRERAAQDLDNTERGVAQSVRANFLNVTSGIAQVRALEQALVSTQSQLDSTILGRDVGVRTSVDVLNAQQQVFQTRRDLQQARYNFVLNTLRLKAAAGMLAEADVEEVNRALGR
ncbi:MAG TPA: TolC family outer membrane protein [Usitatibacter sp.]|nr:TolC family outer membrane protein [Usitatibacter sp.]